ncbi:MAG: hypothetical protein DI565_07790 [Ancylobacter novellus]|uniref:Uncharacterized protein n=1 Tax=Ancylobacter novellus TaxID=921 RepID=A0A2W5KJH4_ANCNO|nr:MAG: hypothetical protein DI565_07790 [Ancylobacter novellus]
MQDGTKPGPDDVEIERHESSESLKKPVDPEAQLDEVGLPPEKWSSLRYGFWPFGGLNDAEEEART